MKKWILVLCIGGLLCANPAFSQSLQRLDKAESQLDTTLMGLRESVLTLMDENKSLMAHNDALQVRLKTLMQKRDTLAVEAQDLNGQLTIVVDKYQTVSDRVAKEGARLEEVQGRLVQAEKAWQEKSNEIQARVENEKEVMTQVQQVRQEVVALRRGENLPENFLVKQEALESDREKLAAQVVEAEEHLTRAKREWEELQRMAQDTKGLNKTYNDKLFLEQEIEAQQKKVLDLRQNLAERKAVIQESMGAGVTEEEKTVLTKEVMVKKKEAEALNQEISSLESKVGSVKRKATQRRESFLKREGSRLEQLKERNKNLKTDLLNLRREMIRMDKKKVILEKDLYK